MGTQIGYTGADKFFHVAHHPLKMEVMPIIFQRSCTGRHELMDATTADIG